jgi:hypothetical protein
MLKAPGSIGGALGKVPAKIFKMGGNFSKKKNSIDKKNLNNNEGHAR